MAVLCRLVSFRCLQMPEPHLTHIGLHTLAFAQMLFPDGTTSPGICSCCTAIAFTIGNAKKKKHASITAFHTLLKQHLFQRWTPVYSLYHYFFGVCSILLLFVQNICHKQFFTLCASLMLADRLWSELKLFYCTEPSVTFSSSLKQPHLGESCLCYSLLWLALVFGY